MPENSFDARAELERGSNELMRPLGLTGPQADALVVIGQAEPIALKDLFASNKLSKSVRLGVANQRVAVRTLFLPAIDQSCAPAFSRRGFLTGMLNQL